LIEEIIVPEHLFWWLLSMACILWYLTITVYVAFKGAHDIKHMLKNLGVEEAGDSPPESTAENSEV